MIQSRGDGGANKKQRHGAELRTKAKSSVLMAPWWGHGCRDGSQEGRRTLLISPQTCHGTRPRTLKCE